MKKFLIVIMTTILLISCSCKPGVVTETDEVATKTQQVSAISQSPMALLGFGILPWAVMTGAQIIKESTCVVCEEDEDK